MAEYNELGLIQQVQQGSLESFNALVLRYQNAVYTLCYRLTGDAARADDAAQMAFINAYQRFDTFRGGSFKAWLMRIATNVVYDAARYDKRRPVTALEDLTPPDSDDGPPLPAPGASPEEALQQRELATAIQDCINALSDEQRAVLVMCDVEGYPYQDIADSLNVQIGTVKSRLSRARSAMRRCLSALGELLPPEYRLRSDE